MNRYFVLFSVGILSVGSQTGCNLFRGPDAENSRRSAALPANAAGPQPVQIYKAPPVAKNEDKVPVRIGAESAPIPAPAQVVTPPAPPRLPGANDLSVAPLPAPPGWKASVNEDAVPLDKIVIVSSKEPGAVKGTLHDLVEPKKLPTETVARVSDTPPDSPSEKTVAPDRTAIPAGRDEKFAVITGQVQVFRKTFRLRYAAVDQEDIYGGVVTLEVGADLSQLRDGKQVRVRGELIPPTERNEPARFRVTAVEPLD